MPSRRMCEFIFQEMQDENVNGSGNEASDVSYFQNFAASSLVY
jgi:hypothetical protein